MSITAACLAAMCLAVPRPEPCEPPDPPCPTGHGDDAYVFPPLVQPTPAPVVADHRPVVRIAAWNGNWPRTGVPGDTYGRADWYKNETPMEVADPNDPMETICIPTGIYNLRVRMDECYRRGFRRMIIMLPAGTLEGQEHMASSQWGPMPGSYRAAYESYIKPWLIENDDVSFGVYAGFPFDDSAGSCSLYIHDDNYHVPNLRDEDDAIQFKENVQPWIDLGAKEYWLDNSSGSPQFFDFLDVDPDYSGIIKFGGEAIPSTTVDDPDCDRAPIGTALARTAWTNDMPNAETRFDHLSPPYDLWDETSLDIEDTEVGVWMDNVGTICSNPSPIPLTLSRAKMFHDLGWVLWGTESATSTTDYLFYTGMEYMQRIYDFGEISSGADFDANGSVNGTDEMLAEDAIIEHLNETDVGYLDGDFNNDNVVNWCDYCAYQDMYGEYLSASEHVPLYLGDHP